MQVEPTQDLDRIDRKILQTLVKDGRISWRELADEVGLSTTPVLRRVKALEESGCIRGYTATLDEARLAGTLSVFVSITLDKQDADALVRFEEQIKLAPEVMSCFLMTGDFDYLLRVVTPSVEAFQVFLTGKLARMPGVAHLKSSFALKAILVRQAPLV
ncbi:Lrp/AsnC family transcriptional regulator [Pseudorhodoferax soli]|uniref:AsnC family transcriptional regulator n=1 Tax=Pseudorhodoferax soli TaxID=545864 RepID=A0A368XSP2_9BURK|nr:Lrp/AsnC family transcriptional regulator [Pseudorhodoferax soli]RCW69537.1 AsnC family transcriptional regulator [Pseudorhodoferax soli]